MNANKTRGMLLAGVLGLTTVGCTDQPMMDCAPGIVQVTATYNGTSSQADNVSIDILIDGKLTHNEMRNRTPGVVQDNFTVDLNTITVGKMADITATALRGSMTVGSGHTQVTRSDTCQKVNVEIGEVVAMPDLAMPDLSMPDLAPHPDLTPPADLSPPPDLMPSCAMNADCQKGGLASGACCVVNGAAACVDTATSSANCGSCGNACLMGSTCCAGGCKDPMVDRLHCGGCGKACVVKNNTPACKAGVCDVGACMMGYADCDKDATTGCEVLLATDAKNCGACGVVCPVGATCQNSQCVSVLSTGAGWIWSVRTADLNGDNLPDVVTSSPSMMQGVVGKVNVFLNQGKGAFAAHADTQPKFDPWGMNIGDFNNDKVPDIVTGFYQGSTGNGILLNDGKGVLTPQTFWNHGNCAVQTVGDFDGDGALDLICLDGRTNVAFFYFFPGDGKGAVKSESFLNLGATGPQEMAAADIDGDKVLDLVSANYTDNNVTVLKNNGKASFTPTNYPVGLGPYTIGVGDLNGDGKPDYVVGASVDKKLNILLNKGDGTLLPKVDVVASVAPVQLVLADMNGDMNLDVVYTEGASVYVSKGDGKGGLGASVRVASGSQVRVADFDGDGHLDVVSKTAQTTATVFYLNVQ